MAKYDSAGTCSWVKKICSLNNQTGLAYAPIYCMKIVRGELFVSAPEWATSFTIDTITVNHPGQCGHLLGCLNLEGSIQWLREGPSPDAECGVNLSTDNYGNIFVTGSFYDSINFSGIKLYSNSLHYDLFIVKYSNNGNVQWGRSVHTFFFNRGGTIVADLNGNSYVSGFFNGTLIFGSDTLVANTTRDMFLAKYSSDGESIKAVHFGNAEGLQLGLDPENKPIVVGIFNGTVNIGSASFTSYGDEDIFIAKLDQLTGIEQEQHSVTHNLIIYANPTEGKCTLVIPDDFKNEKSLTLTIYDSQGKMIQNIPLNIQEGRISLNIGAEAAGIYNVTLTNGHKTYSGKIIFRKS